MKTASALIVVALMALAAFAFSESVYSMLPDRVPTHWGASGQVDGYGSRDFGAFFMPGMIAAMAALLLILPWLSPKNFKVDNFRETFNFILIATAAMLGVVHVASLEAALHPKLDAGRIIITAVCLLLATIGVPLRRVERNFWMGFRTPWTLASEEVWVATHRLGGTLFVAVGLLGAVLSAVGASPLVVLVIVLVGALAPLPYSLVLSKWLEARGKG